jgi:hypothetical protein
LIFVELKNKLIPQIIAPTFFSAFERLLRSNIPTFMGSSPFSHLSNKYVRSSLFDVIPIIELVNSLRINNQIRGSKIEA